IAESHKRKLKVVLDGVFNHMGRHSPHLARALADPKSKQRSWFYTGKQYAAGYRGWLGGTNLPVLDLDSASLQEYIWKGKDSVIKTYLDLGIDGWRLDVAYEIGHEHLAEMRKAAHKAKPGSLVFGEIWGYPEGWFNSVDGQHNMLATDLAREMFNGAISGGQVGKIWNDLVTDAGIDNLLKCWIVADNHDTPRLPSQLPKFEDRQLMIALMMTLPGCPNVYYGSELGMEGGGDPENRAPMRWDLNTADNQTLAWTKKMIGIRGKNRALRFGDFHALQTEQLFAFTRTSGYLKDSVVVVVNPTSKPITETFAHRIGKLMGWQEMKDSLSTEKVFQKSGLMTITVPPKSIRILTPVMTRKNGFSPTDRIK
ncbi:MAG TPA: alpha-amylase family glycosyl hydrolase, partial [Fimbriimonas sp.]|nr:alpha-amylase family glycosyl hydrolase [Fimbriimonas sp.]